MDCDDKCLVYLLTCNVCHLQYVGQTTDRFRMRWNNYKCCNRKALNGELVPQIDFHRHYFQNGHRNLPNDCSIILIDKTDPKKPCERETFWIHKLKTMVPFGLNTVESIGQWFDTHFNLSCKAALIIHRVSLVCFYCIWSHV